MDPAALRPARRTLARHLPLWLVIAAASLWLRSGFPIHAIGDAGLDDALFVRLARSIGAGAWLGPFDNTTLVKGAFYPVFLLAAFLAGIPLKLAEQAAYLGAAALAARLLVGGPGRPAWPATLLFAALAFNPVFWNVELARVIREGLYGSLALATVALAVGVTQPRRPGLLRAIVGGVLLGLGFGAFWLTREEGVWLLPALATIGLIAAFRRPPVRPVAAGLVAAALATAGLIGANRTLNLTFYGVADTVEVKSAPFTRAYGALSRIRHQHWRRWVVVPQDARLLAYRVSPAARELQPFLEGTLGATWRRTSCEQQPEGGCTDILASWWQWALRDAVALAGHYSSAPEAARYYTALATEVNDACDRGDIPCLPPRTTLAPPFRWHYLGDTLAAAVRLAPDLVRLGGPTVGTAPSTGPDDQIDAFEDTVGQVGRRPLAITTLHGTIAAPAPVRLAVVPPEQAATRLDVRTDLVITPAEAGPEPQAFQLSTDCPADACTVQVQTGGQLASFPLATFLTAGRHESAGVAVTVAATNQHVVRRGQNRRAALIQRIARPIGRLYGLLAPAAAAAGLLGAILALCTAPAAALRSPLFALAAASIVAILCRLALVAYLDVTAIRSIGVLYLSVATPFVIVLAVTGTLLLPRSARR